MRIRSSEQIKIGLSSPLVKPKERGAKEEKKREKKLLSI